MGAAPIERANHLAHPKRFDLLAGLWSHLPRPDAACPLGLFAAGSKRETALSPFRPQTSSAPYIGTNTQRKPYVGPGFHELWCAW